MGRRLIIVGASARAAAFSTARAGFEPYTIDLFADRDLAQLCPAVRIERYPLGFLRALAAAPKAPWIYTGGLENYPRLVARMAGIRPLLGNGGESFRDIRNPRLLRAVLREEGFSCPSEWTGSDVDSGRWLVKPRRGSGGLGVRFATRDDLAAPPHGAILQEYIAGESASAAFVTAGGLAVLLGATRQLIGRDWGLSPEFLYVGSIGPLDLTGAERARLAQLGEALARRFALVGLFGVDFVRTADQLWSVEVNPRYTASVEVLERVTDRPFLSFHVAACERGELPPPLNVPSGCCAGKAVVYARGQCLWGPPSLAGTDMTEDSIPPMPEGPLSVAWPNIADVPHIGQRFLVGQPIATVFATGTNPDDVQSALRQREAALLASLASTRQADPAG
ncbi:MAG: ATP-grasp domain-containing protein [Planctomycetaceae bacterium]|nr:ATP-grasp domain-containing protein [Planctomycetaceae bacterium]